MKFYNVLIKTNHYKFPLGVLFTYIFKFGKLTHEGRLPDKSLYETSLKE